MGRVETSEIVSKCIADLEMECKSRNIQWKIGEMPAVKGDAAMMKQVFANLIGNAIKYTRNRDPAIIEIECQKEPTGELQFAIKDNGAGFDMKYAEKLFGVFQRMHRPEEFEGTGIGLAIVRRIILRHGGRIWASAVLNGGATFTFTIDPAKEAAGP
jgi:two-component system sensor kinase